MSNPMTPADPARPLRVVAFTSIFPNAQRPRDAPYFRAQSVALSRVCALRMWAPLPWFPGARLARRWSRLGVDTSRVPRVEEVEGLRVEHPRYLRIPRIGLSIAGVSYALALLPRLIARAARPDVLFATWAYPDGAAAALLSRLLGIPAVIQVIGSDVNRVSRRGAASFQLRRLLPSVAGVVAVSRPLAEAMVSLGAKPERVHTICTGLDLDVFRPSDRGLARKSLGRAENGRLVLFVGRLFRDKGVLDLLSAFDRLAARHPELDLAIVGDGPERARCEARAREPGGRVVVTGELEPDHVARWVAACDALALPSWNEGTPNVVLEALGSGRPVVATRVGGIPDVVRHPVQGELVTPHDIPGLSEALARVAFADHDPAAIREASDLMSWPENARRVLEVLRNAASRRSRTRTVA